MTTLFQNPHLLYGQLIQFYKAGILWYSFFNEDGIEILKV